MHLRRYRKALDTLARRLTDLAALEPSQRRPAGRVFWYLFGGMSWRILVNDLGWSWKQSEWWLVQGGVETLLRSYAEPYVQSQDVARGVTFGRLNPKVGIW